MNLVAHSAVPGAEQARRTPLGKYVSQQEMLNPDAREQLKRMLEMQMQEKSSKQMMEPGNNQQWRIMSHGRNRPPLPSLSKDGSQHRFDRGYMLQHPSPLRGSAS